MAALTSDPDNLDLGATLAACRTPLLWSGAFSCAINLLILAVPLYMMQVFDRVLASGSIATLVWLTLIAAATLVALGCLERARGRILVETGAWLSARLAPFAVRRRLRPGWSGVADPLADVARLRGFLGGAAVLPLFDLAWTPLYLLAALALHPWLGALSLVAALLLFALAWLNQRLTAELLVRADRAGAEARRLVDEAERARDAAAALGMGPGLMARWWRAESLALAGQRQAALRAGALVAASKSLRLGLQVALIAAGAALVLAHELTPGAMIAASIVMGRALAPVEQAIGAWRQVVEAHASLRRLAALFAVKLARPATALPAPQGQLAVENIAFAPPGADKPALAGVAFALEPGEALAVIGPSGAGKSTLARLLVGIVPPTAGAVRLDGATLTHWDPDALARHIGYMPQDVSLVSGTVAENIARFGPADSAAVIAAAEAAGAHEMILRLPQGYDTEIGEGGVALAGGQRQRIALARALFGAPRLVVLDEPNAHLDHEGEAALVRAMAALKAAGATLVLVTHRPALVRGVHTMLVLNEGRVQAFGSREMILARLRPGNPRTEIPAHEAAE